MKKYRIVFSWRSPRTGIIYYEIQKSDKNIEWNKLIPDTLIAREAKKIIEQILENEREYIVVPYTVKEIVLR